MKSKIIRANKRRSQRVAIDSAAGGCQLLNIVVSGDRYPTYLAVDCDRSLRSGGKLFGGVAIFPVLKDGRLGEVASYTRKTGPGSGVNPGTPGAPHPHSVELSPDNRFANRQWDIGLDKLLVYGFDTATGTLTPNDPPSADVPPGAGPRHIAFSANARFLYSINELHLRCRFAYDVPTGGLRHLQTISTPPKDFTSGNSGAEVKISASGKFLYCSNRGHNSIAVFSIDQ